jgi:hypothetical protein
MCPINIRRGFYGADRGDRAPTFGDRKAGACANPFQVTTQVRF